MKTGFIFYLFLCGIAAASAQTLNFDANELVAASQGAVRNERPRVAFTENGRSHIVWARGTFGQEGVFHVSTDAVGVYGPAVMLSPNPTTRTVTLPA